MNSACEQHEQNLSAILDGEMATVDLPGTLDHVVDCASCADFYRRSRDLDAAVTAAETPDDGEEEAPEQTWERISDKVAWSRGARPSRWLEWAPRLAAVVLLAFGLWLLQAVGGGRLLTPSDGAAGPETVEGASSEARIEVQVGELDMTESRFVEITAEVLRADQRYHRKMLEVMETVTRPEHREASSEEGDLDEGDERISLGESDRTFDVGEWRF